MLSLHWVALGVATLRLFIQTVRQSHSQAPSRGCALHCYVYYHVSVRVVDVSMVPLMHHQSHTDVLLLFHIMSFCIKKDIMEI